MNRNYSEKTAAQVMRGIYRRNEKQRPAWAAAWIDADGRQVATDSYVVIRLNVPVPGLQDVPATGMPDMGKIYPEHKTDLEELPRPSLEDLRALAAADRTAGKGAPRRYQYAFGVGLPVVDLQKLTEIMRVFPDVRIYLDPEKPLSPLYFRSIDGDALLCQIRISGTPEEIAEKQSPRPIPQRNAERVQAYSLAAFAARFAPAA